MLMYFTSPCSKCEHKKVCVIKPKYDECVNIMADNVGGNEMFNNTAIIFVCPHCTDTSIQEAVLAYKRALQ